VLFVILFWVAVFVVVMRLLTWIARRHPKARNVAAFVVETGAALAVLEALADAGAASSGLAAASRGPLIARAIFFGLVAAGAHFFASNTATSPHALYPPFIAMGAAGLAWLPFPWLRWPIGIGMLAIGCAIGWLKYRSTRSHHVRGPAHEVPQA
jgi:hypothetical protein